MKMCLKYIFVSFSECPTICPALYAPVCGNNGVTYSNSCELGVAACKNPRIKKAHDGPCDDIDA